MNLDLIKEQIKLNLGRRIRVQVFGLRNKKNVYEGILIDCYPNLFIVNVDGSNKSFTYADVVTGEVKLDYF